MTTKLGNQDSKEIHIDFVTRRLNSASKCPALPYPSAERLRHCHLVHVVTLEVYLCYINS